MKKLVLMMVIGLGAAFAAQADLLLYFTANAFDWSGPKYFDLASVNVATLDGTYVDSLLIQSDPTDPSGADYLIESEEKHYYATGYANLAEYAKDGYVFYVETYKGLDFDNPIWGYSKDTAKSYAQLVQGNHIYDTESTEPQNPTAWNVPEPTSGMLLLLGSALLALKRPASRKRCAATSKRA